MPKPRIDKVELSTKVTVLVMYETKMLKSG